MGIRLSFRKKGTHSGEACLGKLYHFYNRWICDDCLDQIAAQSEEVKEHDASKGRENAKSKIG